MFEAGGGAGSAGLIKVRAVMSDLAPTLSGILSIETPSGSVGHILPEVISR